MLSKFKSLMVKTKLLVNTSMLLTLMIVVALVGYNGFVVMNDAMTKMGIASDDVYRLSNIKANMNAARAALVTMTSETDRTKQEAQHAIIKDATAETDRVMVELDKRGIGAKFTDLKKTWEEFRDVRDQRLILHVYKGELQEAKALALGEQAVRFKKIFTLSNELIEEYNKKKEELKVEAGNVFKRNTTIVGLLSAFAVLCGLFLSVIISNMVARPIQVANDVANKIAKGDLMVEINSTSKDEIGQMMESLNHMTQNLKKIVSQTIEASSQVSTAADQIADANQNFSQRITEQAASVEETSSTMEEMSSSIRQTADNAREANKLSQAAKTSAESGIKVMGDTINAMDEINKSSSKIANISNVIEEIAFQTNLLALNAAVEAARAGEHGKGFAVVASEIRNLAQRASQSAKEITGLIEDSVDKTGKGVQLAQDLNKKLEEISFGVKKVADLMDEVAASAQEQASGINQVNTAVTQIDQMTQQNAALVEETSASAEELAAQAKELMSLISFFKVDEAFGAEREAKGKGGSISPARKTIQHLEPKRAAKVAQPVLAHASAAPRRGVVSAEAEGKSNGGFEEF
jgi:methyl-accepting chemotaxis protein